MLILRIRSKPTTVQFTAAAISTLALLGFTSAIPIPNAASDDLSPRSCTTSPLAYISYFEKASPTTSTSSFGQYRLARTGGPNCNTIKSVFRFDNILAGATGCMLQFQLGAGLCARRRRQRRFSLHAERPGR